MAQLLGCFCIWFIGLALIFIVVWVLAKLAALAVPILIFVAMIWGAQRIHGYLTRKDPPKLK